MQIHEIEAHFFYSSLGAVINYVVAVRGKSLWVPIPYMTFLVFSFHSLYFLTDNSFK